MTTFPRHVVRCCDKGTHMSENGLVSGFRAGADAEMIEELKEKVDPRVGGRGYPDGGQEEGRVHFHLVQYLIFMSHSHHTWIRGIRVTLPYSEPLSYLLPNALIGSHCPNA
jgi:hypothetical protein